ncbi:MAG: Na/Pi symporter [Candidatus Latescibacterota bacterium]|nr:Na/Pi symporter [Candidatus Latescibacterota bacterium]
MSDVSETSTGLTDLGPEMRVKVLLQVVLLALVLYVFLVSIGLLGSSFKLFGKDLAQQLIEMTSNPVVGLVAGVLATTLAQSSSTTTSIAVGMVAGGALTIEGAIPVIMGANIGTSVTNTLVSMGHITRREEFRRALAGATVHDFFNIISVLVLLPLEVAFGYLQAVALWAATVFQGVGGLEFSSPIKALTKPAVAWLLDLFGQNPTLGVIVALALMYGSLKFLVDLAKGLVVQRSGRLINRYLFGAPLVAMAFGVLMTVLVQSSSISTSMVVPLVGAGILTLEAVFPYTLGANVGTTITAMLAALATGNIAAVTVAFSHLAFNVAGIVMVYPLPPIRRIPLALARLLATLAMRSRAYAVVYVITVFYALPLALILIWR